MLVFIVIACAAEKRQLRLDDTLRHYGSAIRWGAYADAQQLQKDVDQELDNDFLREIKVTSYEAIRQSVSEDGNRIDQTVEIRYYHQSQGTEKSLIDQQTWEYDEIGETWKLDGKIPKFKSAAQ